MADKKNKRHRILETAAKTFRVAAEAIKCERQAEQKFNALAHKLAGMEDTLRSLDTDVHVEWPQRIEENANVISDSLDKLGGHCNLNQDHSVVIVDEMADALGNISRTLVRGASGLHLGEKIKASLELREKNDSAVGKMRDVAFEFFRSSANLKFSVGLGLTAEERRFFFPNASGCCGEGKRPNPMESTEGFCPEPPFNPENETEPVNQELLNHELDTMGHLADEMAILQLILPALYEAIITAAFLLPSCATQCNVADGTLITRTIFSVSAPLVATLTYQPQMIVRWTYCCWNWCYLFWYDKWIVWTNTGPINLGAPVTLKVGRPPGAALTVANRRANAFNLNALAPPGSPGC